MLDHALNCFTMSISAIMSSTVVVTSVPSSAYHLLASWRPQDVISYHLCEVLSHRMRGSIMKSKKSGDRGLFLVYLGGLQWGMCVRGE